MTEIAHELRGAGFIEGVPGEFANCRVIVEDGKVKRVESLVAIDIPTSIEGSREEASPIAVGGMIESGGFAIVRESGPEMIVIPDGATIAPLTRIEAPKTTQNESVAIAAQLPTGTAFLVDQTLHETQSPLEPLPDAQGTLIVVHTDPSATAQELTMMPEQTDAPAMPQDAPVSDGEAQAELPVAEPAMSAQADRQTSIQEPPESVAQ